MSRRTSFLFLLPLAIGAVTALAIWLIADRAAEDSARAYAVTRLTAARGLLADASREIDFIARSWADLDATFNYVASRDVAFTREQFADARLAALDVDAVIVTDPRGAVLFAHARPTPGDPAGTRSVFANTGGALTKVLGEGSVQGWAITTDGPRLLAARAIRPSAGGQGVRGMVIVVRFYSDDDLRRLSGVFGGELSMSPWDPTAPSDGTLRIQGWEAAEAFAVLTDELGQPSVSLGARPASAQFAPAISDTRNVAIALTFVAAGVASGIVAVLGNTWEARILRLRTEITEVSLDSESTVGRLDQHGDDAIGELGASAAGMLRELQENARREVEAAREASARERFAEAIVRGMVEGIVLLRTDGVCQACNPAAALMLGIQARDVVGDRFAMQRLLGPDLMGQLTVMADEHSPRAEPIAFEADGRSLTLSAETFSRDDDPAGLLIRLRDVTAIVEAEGLRRDLVAVVSHDLRTPLTVIASTIELMMQTRPAASGDDVRMLDMMQRNVERMQELMDDLLDSAALDAGQMQFDFDFVDLTQLCAEMAELHRPQADAKQVTLYVDLQAASIILRADRRRLRQVMANLLGNAVKYSDAGARVWLRLLAEEGAVRVEVINTGHPIAPEEQARIFEKFFRGEHSRRNSRGTGLGLAISRQIVEHHGGRLWLERSDTASNVFAFTLPPEGAPVAVEGSIDAEA